MSNLSKMDINTITVKRNMKMSSFNRMHKNRFDCIHSRSVSFYFLMLMHSEIIQELYTKRLQSI